MRLENKTAAVFGLARAGIPAVKFLAAHGARVRGYDSKTRADFTDKAELESLGIELFLGDHDFARIEECDLIVLSPGLKIHFEPLQSLLAKAEARGVEVIGELELASRFCPCPILGVTGTKGKSTTTKLIHEMLLACGMDSHWAGNTGTPLIEILDDLTPQSWAVVEVSSFQLEKAPTFRPQIAVLLSLLEDHQDFHPTLKQYWETKLKIFANQEQGDTAIFNVDDARVRSYFKSRGGKECSTYANSDDEETATLTNKSLVTPHSNYRNFLELRTATTVTQVISFDEIPLVGAHNISNVATAIGAAFCALGENFNAAKVRDAIRNFRSLPHRLEIVARKDGRTFVNDSQSTIPDASIAALRSFPAPVTLFLGGRAKIESPAYENLMREVADARAKIVVFGEAAEMLEAVGLSMGVEKTQIFRENTLADALKIAKMHSAYGETLILSPACASFDQFSSYEHRGQSFRELVAEID